MTEKLTPGLDYYLTPEGWMVFTEHYLRQRGYCCGNGCRHCPYDRKGDKGIAPKPKGSV